MADNLQPRLRVFAGPNGSGKTTVIKFIRDYKVNDKNVNLGFYINADDIAYALRNESGFSVTPFDIDLNNGEFDDIVLNSGLLNEKFNRKRFKEIYAIHASKITCLQPNEVERLAQIIADYLRKKLLKERKRFSFETVFSHPSKLDIMRQAVDAGYKVYLYFVSTETPDINVFRVRARTAQGGHDVPIEKIKERYFRELGLLHDAAQIAYQAYFFDNSYDSKNFKMFAHFKVIDQKKSWDSIDEKSVPKWFKEYYSDKVPSKR